MVGASKDLPKRHFFRPIISSDVKTCRIGNLLPIQAESLTNDGDTRNPVRPSVNPEFYGIDHRGRAESIFQSERFPSAVAGHVRQCRTKHAAGAESLRNGPFRLAAILAHGTSWLAIPRGDLQLVQPSELQYAESRGVRGRDWRSFADGGRNHVHGNKLAPGPIWIEAVVVSRGSSGLKHGPRKRKS